jgi:F420-0:gamma-glutamyl ligase-like protein
VQADGQLVFENHQNPGIMACNDWQEYCIYIWGWGVKKKRGIKFNTFEVVGGHRKAVFSLLSSQKLKNVILEKPGVAVTKIVILDDFCHRSLLLSNDSLQTPAKANKQPHPCG